MKKFIVLYHVPADVLEQSAKATPEESADGMKEWMKWAEKCGDHLVDLGQPLVNGLKLTPDGNDEPSTRNVAGFSVLMANDLDHARLLMKGHPHLKFNPACEIEIHETMPLPE